MAKHGMTVILTHEHTDFDALASLLAASLLFPEAQPVLPYQLNRNVSEFLALYRNQFPFLTGRELPRGRIAQVILVDTNAANMPKGLDEKTSWLIIDHHIPDPDALTPHADPTTQHVELWHEPLGANVTMLVERIREQDIDLSPVQATLLALGIHEDTGSLTYAGATHRDAYSLAWLMEAAQGANLEVVHQFLRHPLSVAQRTLLDDLVDHSEFLTIAGHAVIIAQAHAPDFTDELSTLAHRVRDVYECDAIFLVVDLGDLVQVVARSVTDDIDVGAVARQLGGGGHSRAAAAPVQDSSLRAVRDQVVRHITAHSQSAVTVRHIMTSGRPQMLAPDMAIEDAYDLMRRYGHEGFPVVQRQDDGSETLLGVLTRREVDRAMSHKLGRQPVRRFMQAGQVWVRPSDPISVLRKTMIEHAWGQVPVVDERGQIIGIVTRTDLIKLWDESEPPARYVEEIDQRLRAALPPVQLALLHHIGQEVGRMNYSAYVVGGFVRDLLLDFRLSSGVAVSASDMDIVIEGDAIAFAERMQASYGGRVVTHKRFGTAKWLLEDGEPPAALEKLLANLPLLTEADTADEVQSRGEIPPHLDFVTARTEFYTAPTVLPTVELSNIKLDLHRRDFTINTLAFCLNPDRWGELLDFYGGLNDLRSGLVRVLHSLSFVDDPTRIMRAVRYEQRFAFQIEPRTLELLDDAIELLDRVTPARIRHELERILQEAQPERALQRLQELGVLARIHPALCIDQWLIQQFVHLRAALAVPDADARLAQEAIERLYWGLLTMRLPESAQVELQSRLMLRSETIRLMAALNKLQKQTARLRDPQLRPSEAVAVLDKINGVAQALYLTTDPDPQVAEVLRKYASHWQHVRPILTGSDLQKLGLPPGPLYGEILNSLRTARLDGLIRQRGQEVELALALILAHDRLASPAEIAD